MAKILSEQLKCNECGEGIDDGDDESTYCGSMHIGCMSDHCEHCRICRDDQ